LKSQKWAISAFGTVFDQSRGLGVIPEFLEALYAERKALQAEKKKWVLEHKRLKNEAFSIKLTPENQNLFHYL
jgi:hypothetical protein